MSSPQVPDPTAGTIYEPTIHRHAYLMLSHLAGYPVLTSEDKLRNSAEPNHRYINYNLEDQQGFHTIASIAKKSPEKIHAITSAAKERAHLPLVSLTGDLSGQMVTFLADTGRSTSIIRPQDLPCSCKDCTEAVESEGIPIEVNGTIVRHPFTVSSEWPLSILGHDLLSKLKSVWMLLHLGIQADAVRKMHKAPPEPVVEEQVFFRIR